MDLEKMMNIRFCDICDNNTQFIFCFVCDENVCEICENAYGCPADN